MLYHHLCARRVQVENTEGGEEEEDEEEGGKRRCKRAKMGKRS